MTRALIITAAVALVLSSALASGVYVDQQAVESVCDAQQQPGIEYAFVTQGDPNDIALLVDDHNAVVSWSGPPPARVDRMRAIGQWRRTDSGYAIYAEAEMWYINSSADYLHVPADPEPPLIIQDCVGPDRPRSNYSTAWSPQGFDAQAATNATTPVRGSA